MDNCVFCKIVAGEIPSKKLYEDDKYLAFFDIAPMAPVHFLVIPKQHILTGISDINDDNADLVAGALKIAARLAKEQGLTSYRIVTNCGPDAGQTVFHLHFHVLGGTTLSNQMA